MPGDAPVTFSLEDMAAIIEDLTSIADELNRGGDAVNAYLLDLVTNRILERSFGGDEGPQLVRLEPSPDPQRTGHNRRTFVVCGDG